MCVAAILPVRVSLLNLQRITIVKAYLRTISVRATTGARNLTDSTSLRLQALPATSGLDKRKSRWDYFSTSAQLTPNGRRCKWSFLDKLVGSWGTSRGP